MNINDTDDFIFNSSHSLIVDHRARSLAKSSSSSLHCDIHCSSSRFIVARGISARVSWRGNG